MNFSIHYDRLISRARNRVLDGYVERHHVIPKCMGGSNGRDNLVQLTAEEHFVAHQLLHKIYPDVAGLKFALINMLGNPHGHRSNKLYGWIRKMHSANVAVQSKARWQDPKYRAKHKASMDVVRHSQEYRDKFSRIHKGRIKSPEECANISKGKTGMKYKKMSAESRANMAAARRKTWAERKVNGTDKVIAAKIVETRRKNGSYTFTDEHRAAISAGGKGREITPAQREKISVGMKEYRATH